MGLQSTRNKHAEDARSLPCELWNDLIMESIMTMLDSTEHPPVLEKHMRGTFIAKAEADMAADLLPAELKAKAGSGARL
jgi:hypothetical protein